ncbi:DGQHR domain-containing protein [Aliarcobacter butzleri]|uniref:DGQHR domain-containing protein n=1 Tax=Aliarcobacter butzleri TaxID=28197 RepID=UPI001EDA5821|nr:DGQHR domain-containing protein [Aliarcobacter butzleri]MCG3708451.1 DGQHR domain-containing protein [Aliarcobacter butzleri]
MNKLPYIKIEQKENVFFITKMNVKDLINLVTFHYRHHKQLDISKEEVEKEKKYFEKLEEKNIKIEEDEKGIQRRLDLKRIQEIKEYYTNSKDKLFPTSVILSTEMDDEILHEYMKDEIGYFDLNDFKFKLRIIDGQHRIAGLFFLNEQDLIDLDLNIPAILIINTTVPKEAELFSIINGKQKTVSKSLIYDLQSEIGEDNTDNIYKYHTICKTFNDDRQSPLYKQIKLLGIGDGAISQAFFIDSLSESLKSYPFFNLMNMQKLFNLLFFYFKAYQNVFPDDWTVPVDLDKFREIELKERSIFILKDRKSQLLKTNGFGAIIKAFPFICFYIIENELKEDTKKKLNNLDEVTIKQIFKKDSENELKIQFKEEINNILEKIQTKDYLEVIQKLKDKIDWTKVNGTGKSAQTDFFKNIILCGKIDSNKMSKIMSNYE